MTDIVPSEDAFAALQDQVTGLDTEVANIGTALDKASLNAAQALVAVSPLQVVLTPEQYGAVQGQDCTAAFTALMADVTEMLRSDAGGSVPVSSITVVLGARSYSVSGAVMAAGTGRVEGLVFRGMGKRVSEIVKTTPGPLFTNQDQWMNVRFYDLSFRGADPGAVFLYSYAATGAQDWVFTNTEWRGEWAYGIGLDGDNLNSEFGWNNCQIGGTYGTAFLWGGLQPAVSQQDQFVNYWFNDCKVEFASGTFVRMDRGGFIKCQGGSYILEGTAPGGVSSQFFLFPQPPTPHADAVQKLAVRDVRFELRNSTHRVITSTWNGHIVFDGCSDTALGFQAFSDDLVTSDYTNPGIVEYRGCDLVGKHAYHATAAPVRQRAVYSACTRKNNRTSATFLETDGKYASQLAFGYHDDGDGIMA